VLAILLGLLIVPGPLLNGAWDLWAQSILLLAALGGCAFWACRRLVIGDVPLPSSRVLAWAAFLAAWAGMAAFLGPLRAYALPAWNVWLAGLGVMLAVNVMPDHERRFADRALRALAWALVLTAFYQYFVMGVPRPGASLLNQNVFAGAILLLLPLAVEKRDWILGAGLLICLAWTRSVGAWLGLAAALLIVKRRSPLWAGAGALMGLACLLLVYAKLDSPDMLHRWQWWRAAAAMAGSRPWFGFGPGTYAYVLPAYVQSSRPLATLFAHQHILETAAQCGWPFALAWLAGLLRFLKSGPQAKRIGAAALLVQSCWDYALSIPGVLWLFCYVAASCLPRSGRVWRVPQRWRLPACALVLAAAGLGAGAVWQRWAAERLRVRAEAMARAEGPSDRALALLERSARRADHPETARLSGQIEAALARQTGAKERLLAAAADMESSAAQDPFRASTWTQLAALYQELGRDDLARQARQRGAATCPGLGAP